MFAKIRKYQRPLSIFFLLSFINMLSIEQAKALTSGPSQPEAQQFAPAGMDNMVDPFTGDFSYNIPLLDVGGYPININYAAGITQDQEASWVGLGWNLNVGAINRSVRGIPDDFAGEPIETQHKIKPNQTFGLSFQKSGVAYQTTMQKGGELFTFEVNLAQNYNIFYNTYNGFGYSISHAPSFDVPLTNAKMDSKYKMGLSLVPSLSLSLGSEDGVGISPSVGLKFKKELNENEATLNSRISFPYSSRQGARGMSMSTSFNYTTAPKTVSRQGSDGNTYSEVYRRSGGFGTSSFLGFAMPTYTPFIQSNVYSVNATFNVEPEKLNLANDKTRIILGGFYQGQFQESTTESNPAYGYMYEGLNQSDRAVLDFNREKDGGYNEKTTNMPVTNHTYDIFSVQGQGVGGTFRLFRSDVGTVGDNVHTETDISPDLAISGGVTAKDNVGFKDIKIGADFKYIQGNISAGRWTSPAVQNYRDPLAANDDIKENVFFGKVGDMAPENNIEYFNNTLLGDELYAYKLNVGYATGEVSYPNGSGFLRKNLDNDYLRCKRKNRNTSFTYLTAEKAQQAEQNGVSEIFDYDHKNFAVTIPQSVGARRNQNVNYSKQKVNRVEGVRKPQHISQISHTDNSGSRYIYGIPVYNKSQVEVSFSVDAEAHNQVIGDVRSKGKVIYSPSDASLANNKGLDHYFHKTITQGHATAYLLSHVLSSDYVDSDNVPGPSDGDLGTYVKFNYARTSDNYKWRTPYERNTATYADGLAGKRIDDKASYTYGEKEIWYLHSIETRTHVAEFHISAREDGIGVAGEHGGLPGVIQESDRLMKLDKIVLYSKADKVSSVRPEPLKTVHFKYNYALCPHTPNSIAVAESGYEEKGKLTLESVYFTYGMSHKGVLNPYTFKYADTDFDGNMDVNYPYNSKNYDRWGQYKEQQGVGNEVFPYTLQQKNLTDRYAAAYALTSILTPTGGEIRVHYESDDYGYVQNQQAMRMFNIIGVSSSNSPGATENLYDNIGSDLSGRLYLHINLNEGFSADAANAVNYFKTNYLGGLRQLQYRVKVNVFNSSDEYINGYLNIDPDQISVHKTGDGQNSNYDLAIIRVQPEKLNNIGADMHPFIKNGWLYARLHYNRELCGSVDATSNAVLQVLGSIKSAITSVLNLTFGFKNTMKAAGHSKRIVPSESFIRLYEHDKFKLGGGHRVKAIVMLDRWSDMISDREGASSQKESSAYGQVYTYTTHEDPSNPSSRIISSGVAAYEPFLGGEENPFRKLVKTTDEVPFAPDREYYTETPFGESFFPSPIVGYSKVVTTPVKITGMNYDVGLLESNGTGYIEQEFYTAFDFPTYTSYTDLQNYRERSPRLSPLKIQSSDFVSCSQGYLIELNDMHGKPKSVKVMPDQSSGTANPISYVKYIYKVQEGNPNKLDSSVPLVNQNLDVTYLPARELGTIVDVVNDTRQYTSVFSGGGADINVKLSFPPPFPVPPAFVPLITVFPDVNFERTKFSSVTTTKVVNRFGVLVKTIAMDNGQTITTQNLLWDEETGEVLLTRVENEFHDPIFNFTYPGHWAYPEMKLAYKNEGLEFASLAAIQSELVNGDELICRLNDGSFSYVYYKNPGMLIEKSGTVHNSVQWARVVRSGARNVATVPVGSIVTLNNPVEGNKVNFANAKVLNAGASEYKNVWKGFCNCGEQSYPGSNPFTTGQEGQLRPWRSWTYLTERSQNIVNGQVNIKQDGVFTDFSQFWIPNSDYLKPYYNSGQTQSDKWQWITVIENYNPIGMEIENRDALNRYSMAQFGYGRNLPVATSNNSKYQETGFDGFEDYDYGDCNDDHFSWRAKNDPQAPSVVSTQSHTGRKSIKIAPKSSSKIVKIIDPCNNTQQ